MGAQNRAQEAPKGDKERYRKKKIENRRKEEHQERQKEPQKAVPPFGPATPERKGKQLGRPKPLGAPTRAVLRYI